MGTGAWDNSGTCPCDLFKNLDIEKSEFHNSPKGLIHNF